ncbi:hypothetical protein BJ875DRAFT_165984 [Amylocarpus encephaloides]|uniref:2EXR domain-containing protein n=1 Tax=Amylocarpus encephaloides TaxID=45428 RepID=A0A9P8C1P1_9HELO|nr:hypothetical protein BJ875DRAFT_165984 [Amylocarpus encephaloides]
MSLQHSSELQPCVQRHIQASTEANQFHPFPGLPYEIQAQIWQDAIASIPSRMVTLRPKVTGNENPSILHVSHQARVQGFKQYHRCTANSVDPKSSLWQAKELEPQYVGDTRFRDYAFLVDYTKDHILLNHRESIIAPMMQRQYWLPKKLKTLQLNIANLNLALIRHLAFSTRHSLDLTTRIRSNPAAMSCLFWHEAAGLFPGLESCTFVVGDNSRKRLDLRGLVEIGREGEDEMEMELEMNLDLLGMGPMIRSIREDLSWMKVSEGYASLGEVQLGFMWFEKG